MNIRERIEKNEKLILNPYAALSINSKGRVIKENKDEMRTNYMVDRDRIIHCKSFIKEIKDSSIY